MNTLVIALHGLVNGLVTGFAQFADKTPAENDVVAGWGAFWIFLGLGAAVVFLCISLVRHLKKAQANEEAGVFGSDEAPEDPKAP